MAAQNVTTTVVQAQTRYRATNQERGMEKNGLVQIIATTALAGRYDDGKSVFDAQGPGGTLEDIRAQFTIAIDRQAQRMATGSLPAGAVPALCQATLDLKRQSLEDFDMVMATAIADGDVEVVPETTQ